MSCKNSAVQIPQPEVPQDAAILSGEEIHQRYIDAIGGEKAWINVRTVVLQFDSVWAPSGKSESLLIKSKGENMGMSHVSNGGKLYPWRGMNGGVGWKIDGEGVAQILEGQALKDLFYYFDIQSDLNWKKYFTSIKSMGRSNISGTDAYEVLYLKPNGDRKIRYYDPQSFLRLQETTIRLGEEDNIQTTIYSDYREVSKLKYAYKMVHSFSSVEFQGTDTLVRFETNVDMPDSQFVLPVAVAKLLESQNRAP